LFQKYVHCGVADPEILLNVPRVRLAKFRGRRLALNAFLEQKTAIHNLSFQPTSWNQRGEALFTASRVRLAEILPSRLALGAFLEQKPLYYLRHCEERSDEAISWWVV